MAKLTARARKGVPTSERAAAKDLRDQILANLPVLRQLWGPARMAELLAQLIRMGHMTDTEKKGGSPEWRN